MDHDTQLMMKQIATDAAEAAVEGTLIKLGIDHNNPIDAQKDMAALRELRELTDDEEWRADMIHLRKWRQAMEGVERKGIMAGLGFAVMGVIAFAIYHARTKLGV